MFYPQAIPTEQVKMFRRNSLWVEYMGESNHRSVGMNGGQERTMLISEGH
jgi:hypothetical protein